MAWTKSKPITVAVLKRAIEGRKTAALAGLYATMLLFK